MAVNRGAQTNRQWGLTSVAWNVASKIKDWWATRRQRREDAPALSPSPSPLPTPRPLRIPQLTRLHERDAIALFLVRAVEEHDDSFFTPEVLSEAALAAVDAGSDAELLDKRTAYLFLRLPKSIRDWTRLALLPEDSLSVVVLVTFFVGALSNYLGPSGVVHVARNPLAFLIVWNLGVYTLLAWRRLARRRSVSGSAPPAEGPIPTAPVPRHPRSAEGSEVTDRGNGLVRRLVPLWLTWHRWIGRMRSAGTRITNAGKIAASFWEAYWASARSLVIARAESLFHVGAMSLFLGALAGTYVRGLFFEYNAVWRSTFVTEPRSVATFLNLLLGPAGLLLNGSLLTPEAVQPLLSPQGTIAAAWIHQLALMGALVILVPRAILAALAVRHAGTLADRIEVDLSEPYYAETIRAAREGQIHRVRDGIANAIHLEIGKFSESVALFVRDRFFDKIVAPRLLSFRNKGGRLSDLETELAEQKIRFEPELSEYLRTAQLDFEQSVRTSVLSVVGREVAQLPSLVEEVGTGLVAADPDVTGSVAATMGDAIAASVTAAVTVAVATISGGVGKSLGLAIVAGLLHTSGPIGLLIGGVGAFVAVGGAYLFGRDRVTAAMKGRHLPSFLVARALRDATIERAREATYSHVRQESQSRLEPQVQPMVETILQQLSLSMVAIGWSNADA